MAHTLKYTRQAPQARAGEKAGNNITLDETRRMW